MPRSEEDRSLPAAHTLKVRNSPGQHQIAEQASIPVVHAPSADCSLLSEDLTSWLINTLESQSRELADNGCFAAPWRTSDHKEVRR